MCLIADENKNIILPRETHISSYTVSCKVTANHSLKDSLRLIKTQNTVPVDPKDRGNAYTLGLDIKVAHNTLMNQRHSIKL